jgi:hypothetical protein
MHSDLGADTLILWFVKFPHVYSPAELLHRTRIQFSQRGFLLGREMRSMGKLDLLAELAKLHEVAAWCGGAGCGAYCRGCDE